MLFRSDGLIVNAGVQVADLEQNRGVGANHSGDWEGAMGGGMDLRGVGVREGGKDGENFGPCRAQAWINPRILPA